VSIRGRARSTRRGRADWATHGAPVTDNAHPIFSRDELALVHNGIIENYETLRAVLRGKGYEFVSQTDSKVIAHLIHSMYRGDLFQAVREAVAVAHKEQPHLVVGARQGSPFVVGLGDGENFLASDAIALTKRIFTVYIYSLYCYLYVDEAFEQRDRLPCVVQGAFESIRRARVGHQEVSKQGEAIVNQMCRRSCLLGFEPR
jgi:hypothetical protein